MSLNKVMLIGNVGMDPEVRYLDNSQSKVARIRLATTERYTDRNGESRENTEWHTVEAWRRLADLIERYVKKGSQIYVEGRLRTREWTDQTGNKRYSTEVLADNIQLLGKRDSAEGAPQGQYNAPRPAAAPVQSPAGPGGYQAPYQPVSPAQPAQPQSVVTPAPAPQPSTALGSFGADENDDLPF